MMHSNWQTKRLGECLIIRHGRSQRKVEKPNGIYPILGTGGEIGRTDAYLYNKPSVLIGRKGTIDKPRYMDTPFWTVDTLFYSEILDNIDAKFMYYVFNTIDWQKYNEASGVPSLSASTISNIEVQIPEKRAQKQIVTVLEIWDQYIEILEHQIRLKELLLKGMMQQLLSARLRLPGFSANWTETYLGDVVSVQKGKSLTSKDLIPGPYPVIAGGQTSPYTHAQYTHENVVTVSASGAYAGFVSYHTGKIWASDCSVITAKPGQSVISYMYYFMSNNQKRIYATQVGGAQPHVYPKDISRIKIQIPDSNEQIAIVRLLANVAEQIKLCLVAKRQVQRQKQYLLKSLLTGTLRAPENLTMVRQP